MNTMTQCGIAAMHGGGATGAMAAMIGPVALPS